MINRSILLLSLLLVSQFSYSANSVTGKERRVLWVGNSLTNLMSQNADTTLRRTWSIPKKVTAWASLRGYNVYSQESCEGGADLAWHIYTANVGKKIDTGTWDNVVIQPSSMEALNAMYPSFKFYISILDSLAKKKNVKPVFYMTHAYQSCPFSYGCPWLSSMQDSLTNHYRFVADSLGDALAPVGAVHGEVRKERPDINLYKDYVHHSFASLYLVASVFMITLFNEDPRGLPAFPDWPVDTATISYLQQKAWTFCNRTEWSRYTLTGTEMPSMNVSRERKLSLAPNPFSPSVTITLQGYDFNDETSSNKTVTIVDTKGCVIRTLKLDQTNRTVWDGRNSTGISVSRGFYAVRIGSGKKSLCSKLFKEK
ncbi:MAG: hypothetical protein JNL74_18055 [Fibrobacteres bacterium]|nr:hypothetical protein [Fibrobacterota bacterium]